MVSIDEAYVLSTQAFYDIAVLLENDTRDVGLIEDKINKLSRLRHKVVSVPDYKLEELVVIDKVMQAFDLLIEYLVIEGERIVGQHINGYYHKNLLEEANDVITQAEIKLVDFYRGEGEAI